MKYRHIKKGIFRERPNRFVARVEIEGKEYTVHVKNTGRCRELLVPGATVFLEYDPDAAKKGRKTQYSLVAVYKGGLLINMDSQAPNEAAEEWLTGGGFERATGLKPEGIHREVTYGQSRFDLAFTVGERQAFMEIKGGNLGKGWNRPVSGCPDTTGSETFTGAGPGGAGGGGRLCAVCDSDEGRGTVPAQ